MLRMRPNDCPHKQQRLLCSVPSATINQDEGSPAFVAEGFQADPVSAQPGAAVSSRSSATVSNVSKSIRPAPVKPWCATTSVSPPYSAAAN